MATAKHVLSCGLEHVEGWSDLPGCQQGGVSGGGVSAQDKAKTKQTS